MNNKLVLDDDASDEEEQENSYFSDPDNAGDDELEKKKRRKQIGGVSKEDTGENVIVFKRMTDIHTLNLKYFKYKPGAKDVKPEEANDMKIKIQKSGYL